jgi:predicted lipoprotein with Yx(FWY)xxD motif/uncharacterized protein YcnI
MNTFAIAGAAALLVAGSAQAHVVLQPAAAAPGGVAQLRFAVGHGCSGQPTTALRIELPHDVKLRRVEPKAGWSLQIEGGAVTWRGSLPPTERGEFVVEAQLPRATGVLLFPATQTCGDVAVRWSDPPSSGARPAHPAPALELTTTPVPPPEPAATGPLPAGVQRRDGYLADAAGRPLYTFAHDTMVGMSHCVGPCAAAWPPLAAPADAQPLGAWKPIWRDEGTAQWTYRDKPLYTYSEDTPGAAPKGEAHAEWRLAR